MIQINKFLIITLFLLSVFTLEAQESDSVEQSLNIDSLFEKKIETEEILTDNTEEKIDLLKDIVKNKGFSLGSSFRLNMGYSPGWMTLPGEFQDTALLESSSVLSVDMQISSVFRVLQKFAISYPEFKPEITEFFADYTIADRLFLRAGRQNITWGISRNFPYTNLPARIPDNFPADGTDNYAIKLNIPFGVGGFEALIFTRDGFLNDPAQPKLEEFGFGGKYNLALNIIDISIAGFYQKDIVIPIKAPLSAAGEPLWHSSHLLFINNNGSLFLL